jgi:hypothetical protein
MLSPYDDRGAYANLEQSLVAPEGVLSTTTAIVSTVYSWECRWGYTHFSNDENSIAQRFRLSHKRGDGSLLLVLDRMKQSSNLLSEGQPF